MSALVVAVCFASGTLEALIPSVHDGDTPAALLTTGNTDHSSIARTDGDMRDAAPIVATVSMAASDHSPTPSTPAQSGYPSHAFHVDHCGHAHLAALSAAVALPPSAPVRAPHHRASGLEPVSIELAPRLRPPIA